MNNLGRNGSFFEYLTDRFNPRDEIVLVLLSHPGIVRTGYLDILRPVINPWVNLYEVLALAWKHGWVDRDDIKKLEEATILGLVNDDPALRDRKLLGQFRLLREPDSSPLRHPPWSSRFDVFAESHWSFRQEIGQALFGLQHQDEVIAELCPGGRFSKAEDAADWLQTTGEANPLAVAFKGLFELETDLNRIEVDFFDSGLGEDLREFYRPWRQCLKPLIRQIVAEFVAGAWRG